MQLIEIPEQTSTEDIDEEILEIFVEEVDEVLGEIVKNFKAWKANPDDTKSLQSLRRAFHTLKGSGRLVGATVIGELGWRFENMLNRVIDGAIPRNNKLLTLINQVETVLPSMVKQFRTQAPTPHEVILLISQADYYTQTKGESIGDFEPATAQNQSPPTVTQKTVAEISETQPKPEIEPTATEQASEETSETISEFDDTALDDFESSDTFETQDFADDLTEDSYSELPEQDFSSAEELDETDFSETEFEDFDSETLEDVELNFEDNVDNFDLETLSTEEFEAESFPETEELLEEETTEKSTFDFEAQANDRTADQQLSSDDEENDAIDPVLFGIFQKEARQHIKNLQISLEKCERKLPVQMDQDIIRAFHTLNGSSRSVEFLTISNIAAPLENYARELLERQIELTPEILSFFHNGHQLIEQLLEGQVIDEFKQHKLLKNIEKSLETLPPPQSESAGDDTPEAGDEFMAIFLEEADELLENTQSLLERWQATPDNMQLMKELQRELHTLKGGARMVGITPMGDLSHHLESVLTRIVEGGMQVQSKLQETVQNSVDELAAMLEAVRSGVPLEMPADLVNQINAALISGDEAETTTETAPAPSAPPGATQPEAPAAKPVETPEIANKFDKLVAEKEAEQSGDGGEDRIRVRVTLIDKLTNLAGELSISRAHMEQQQGAFKNNLIEMEQTVIRLRDQLRRLEIETEAQILSHFSGVKSLEHDDDEEFDPLELDRFSAMQQLSRSLMESVSDLINIQDALKTLTRQSDSLLIQQARIGAELQEGIMRTRMIPFGRISPRLQRIARLTARELHKQVDFIINGENIEFERTVLNRIVAPLEHMLRNAIGHGIEDAPTRQAADKPTTAKITIDLAKEGSELVIKLSDDGAGLNLMAIRKKAEERNMIQTGQTISDQELMQFILEPAFSTAQTITQVSGRGVGMDVVSNEIKQLSGSLQIYSKAGEGTTFEIRLPLSLTINQALMVHIGEETMAVPLNNVEAVMRAPRAEVQIQAEEVRYYKYMDNNYRIYHLGDLVGFGRAATEMNLIPTLLIRAADRRVALVVDSIEGSKEIVVKSVGPQIGAIRGIAGATILGDGRVVIILDIPGLIRADTTIHYVPATEPRKAVEEEKPATATIMVVDDSITVRKVTARLLKRQGMEVLTAKDGVDAVAQLQEHIPDLMLLDVEMPRMDGYELATQVRNSPELKHIPIIMITSRTGSKHRSRAEKIGIDRYLGKPFNESELLENINALLKGSTPMKGLADTNAQ